MGKSAAIGEGDELGEGIGPSGSSQERCVSYLLATCGAEGGGPRAG